MQQQRDIVMCKDQAATSAEPRIKLGITDKKNAEEKKKKEEAQLYPCVMGRGTDMWWIQ